MVEKSGQRGSKAGGAHFTFQSLRLNKNLYKSAINVNRSRRETAIENKETSPEPGLSYEPGRSENRRHRLVELARLFTVFGFTAFGGPAAHIAMFQDEVVQRRRWMDEKEYMDLLGATNLIPGPN